MRPNRLHCGNIAAHTAFLVILPRESTWGGTGRLITGYNFLSWENGQWWYRPAGTGRCRTVRKYPSRTFFRGVMPVIAWVVPDGAMTSATAWPWPAAGLAKLEHEIRALAGRFTAGQ
jgi:hypothetical protein